MKHRTVLMLALCFGLLLIARVSKLRSQEGEISKLSAPIYHVACLPSNVALRTKADAALRPYYQIAHTTRESDKKNSSYRCYFRLPDDQIMCINPQVARIDMGKEYIRKMGFSTELIYSGAQAGKECYFREPATYRPLIETLKRHVPHAASMDEYEGVAVKNAAEAIEVLSAPF